MSSNPTQGTTQITQCTRMGCAHCGGTSGVFVDGAFVFRLRHNGQIHPNAISAEQIIQGIGAENVLRKLIKTVGTQRIYAILGDVERAA